MTDKTAALEKAEARMAAARKALKAAEAEMKAAMRALNDADRALTLEQVKREVGQ